MAMTSNKPYLIRAFYDWIVDNECTPYILVDATYPGVQVPSAHIRNEQIVLNISPVATRGLLLENDRIVFSARFSGQTEQLFVPPNAVLEIYAQENGRGIALVIEPVEEGGASGDKPQPATASKKKPGLKLVE
jgi:stringent starvation protein B